MNLGFREGYYYFQKSAGAAFGAFAGDKFGTGRAEYIDNVEDEISNLEKSINEFMGDNTPVEQLKGKVAEVWHASTFNVNAVINRSTNKAFVPNSNKFGSADILSNFSKEFGLKYYVNGEESAKQQAISVFQRFKEYQYRGGNDDLEKFLHDRNYTTNDILNDPVYSGQIRVIPKDQMDEAINWLKRQINIESVRRPEQVKRYKETLMFLRDRVSDNKGNESIPLSEDDAKKLAAIAKKGEFKAKEANISVPELLPMEMLVKESLKAGLSAAVVSLVLRIGPEIFKSIDYLIKNGEIDERQFKEIGLSAVTGSCEGFIRGSVASAISMCCKSGLLGENLRSVNTGVIGTIVVIAMNTMKNAFQVAIGKKSKTELTNDLIRNMIVSSASLVGGNIAQGFLGIPVLGYLVGSFVGSIVGSFIYNAGYKTAISFCTETGVTLFGLVEYDYSLPEDVIADIGLKVFDYETFTSETFEPASFEFDTFDVETIQPDSIGIRFLRRGVIGVSKIGYVG